MKERKIIIPEAEKIDDQWDVVISPKRHLLDINLKELWECRDLLYMFVKRDVVTVYKQTILGPIWFCVQPILTMLVYIVVFGNIAKIPTDGVPAAAFYMSGIVMWNYFAETFSQTSNTFVENSKIFGKVYFPRLLLPLSKVVSGAIKFFIQWSLFLVILLYFFLKGADIQPGIAVLLTPFFVLLMAGLGLGAGLIISSLTTKYRDLTFLVSFGVQLLMYATPVIYPMSTIPERYKTLIWANPMAHVIEGFKFAFLGAGNLTLAGLSYATFFTIVLLFVGIVIFNKTEQNFMDTV